MFEIGHRLRSARENCNFTQVKVFELTGINNKTLSGYENNVSHPDLETLVILADLYKVSTDYLLGRTNIYSFGETIVSPHKNKNDQAIISALAHCSESNKEILLSMLDSWGNVVKKTKNKMA